jgi:diacylglycerol kinase family enzyme
MPATDSDAPTPAPLWTKATVVLNRESGAVSSLGPETLAEDLKTEFLKHGITATVHLVKGSELEATLKQAKDDDSDAVVVGGGDGTVAAAAALLAGGNKPLGVLPFGTFNIVARDLNIPLDWKEAVAALSTAPATRMDLMEVNGGLYCCVCVLGFFPALKMAQPEHHGNWVVRTLQTCMLAFRSMATFPPLDLKLVLDGREIHRRTRFALLANNDYEEMFGLIPKRKSINGGYFTLYVSNHRTNIGMTRALISWILGRFKQDKELTIFHTDELDIVVVRKGMIPVMVDGEVKKLTSPLKIRTRPQELCVLAPEVMKETVEHEKAEPV